MSDNKLETIVKLSDVGFTHYSGCRLTATEAGRATGEMEITKNHENPYGAVHGGAIFTLADNVGGCAVRTLGGVPTTCTSTINYMRPTFGCTKLVADAKVLKHGANTAVVDISIYDQGNTEVAHVLATYFDVKDKYPKPGN